MDLTDQERNLILAGLFELTITYADDDEQRERCKTLAAKLGGDPDELAAHLAKYPAGKELGLIFTNDQGEPISRTRFSVDVWQPAVSAAKIPKGVGFHALRHYYASLLIAESASVKTVQARLGHATPSRRSIPTPTSGPIPRTRPGPQWTGFWVPRGTYAGSQRKPEAFTQVRGVKCSESACTPESVVPPSGASGVGRRTV